MRLSLICPISRPTYKRMLASAVPQLQEGDELLLITTGPAPHIVEEFADHPFIQVFEGPSTSRKGDRQRDVAIPWASGDYIALLDDDDIWLPGARAAIEKAAEIYAPKPLMFELEVRNLASGDYEAYGRWGGRHSSGIAVGHTMGCMLVTPNKPLPKWADMPSMYSHVDEGMDYHWVKAVLEQYGPPAWIQFPIIRTKVDG